MKVSLPEEEDEDDDEELVLCTPNESLSSMTLGLHLNPNPVFARIPSICYIIEKGLI